MKNNMLKQNLHALLLAPYTTIKPATVPISIIAYLNNVVKTSLYMEVQKH